MLRGTYFPNHKENLMKYESDVETARFDFFSKRPNNLTFLLRNRYKWMNKYIQKNNRVLELGAGAGFSKEFIKQGKLEITDIVKYPWIDRVVDALNPSGIGKKESVDIFICSQMIHHLSSPINFFQIINEYLKPGGYILIQEPHTSLLMRIILRIMRHEGWSYDVDVFDEEAICNDPRDPWSANNAIAELLFQNPDYFSKVTGLEVVKSNFCECLLFPLSGGVTAKSKTIQLPLYLLSMIDRLDKFLVWLAPSFFALGRSVVLKKYTN